MSQPDTKIGFASAAKLLGIAQETLKLWIRKGKFPPPEYSLGGSPRFSEPVIRGFLLKRGKVAKNHVRLLGQEPLVTLARAAEICRVSRWQVSNWRAAGGFPEARVGASGRVLFVEREIVAFARKRHKRLSLGHLYRLDASDPLRTALIREVREIRA